LPEISKNERFTDFLLDENFVEDEYEYDEESVIAEGGVQPHIVSPPPTITTATSPTETTTAPPTETITVPPVTPEITPAAPGVRRKLRSG